MARETSDFNRTPSADRVHISFFGKRNAGKSSVVNAVTCQKLSIVSPVKGTTTDPVKKAMELLPLGPVVIIDTPGIDDEGTLGEKRIEKTYQILNKTDAAVLVVDSSVGLADEDAALMDMFKERKIPFVVAFNKSDLVSDASAINDSCDFSFVNVSATQGINIEELKKTIARIAKPDADEKKLIGDKLSKDDIVILVTPVDSSAPKGRMILPQVQTIRDILDANCCCMVTQTEELPHCLDSLKSPPAMVVTDSQVFNTVKDMVPASVPLTSFSILFARFKGQLDIAVDGAQDLRELKDGDTVLISEGCTHHRQCEDIGTVKLPGWIENYTGKTLDFQFTSGGDFPTDPAQLGEYALIVHCGGCMLNEREMTYRMNTAHAAGIPFTNYGTLIAEINGILNRSIQLFR